MIRRFPAVNVYALLFVFVRPGDLRLHLCPTDWHQRGQCKATPLAMPSPLRLPARESHQPTPVRNARLDNACSNLNWYRNSKIFVSYRSTTPVSDELACSLLFALSLRAVKRSGGTIRRDCRVQHIMHAPNRCSPTITIIEIRFKVDLRRQGFWVTETVFPTLPSHSCARWVLGGRPRLGGFMQKYLRACNCALNYTGNIDGNANNTPGYLEPQKWVVVIGRFTRSCGNDYER